LYGNVPLSVAVLPSSVLNVRRLRQMEFSDDEIFVLRLALLRMLDERDKYTDNTHTIAKTLLSKVRFREDLFK
jgi:hypothetical protein